jgi:hypothetical protein
MTNETNQTHKAPITLDAKPAAISIEEGRLVVHFTEQFRKSNSRIEFTAQEVIDLVNELRPYAIRFAESKA